jgi:putative PIN family toxin of toxin-antitoxin system
LRLVLDTNVVIDLFVFRSALSRPIADALSSGRAVCFADGGTLSELERVLNYPELKLDAARQAATLADYRQQAQPVPLAAKSLSLPVLPRCRDRDDQQFLELAARVGADWLVSRDKLVLKLARNKRTPAPFRIGDTEALGAVLAEA